MGKKAPESLSRRVGRALRRSGVRSGERLLVAFSGGVDSLVLLHLLSSMRSRGRRAFRVLAAHLDHGVRGEEAAADARAAAALCRRWRIPLVQGRLDPREVRSERRRQRSLEGALRTLRYRFLRTAAGRTRAGRVILAHQADDQVETVLMRALARKDWRALAGIPDARGPLLRPFLAGGEEVSRARIASYARERRLVPREDESNLDPAFARNRVRHAILPALRESFHPGLDALLLRLCSASRSLLQTEESLVRRTMADGVGPGGEHGLLAEARAVRRLHRLLKKRPSRAQVEAYLRLEERGEGEQEVAGGTLFAERGRVSFRRGLPLRHRRRMRPRKL